MDSSTLGVSLQKRADGKIQAQVSLWDDGDAQPDIEITMSFFYPAQFARPDWRSDLARAVEATVRSSSTRKARSDLQAQRSIG